MRWEGVPAEVSVVLGTEVRPVHMRFYKKKAQAVTCPRPQS